MEAAQVLDFANSLYGHMLRCLVQAYGRRSTDADGKRMTTKVGTAAIRNRVFSAD